MDNSHSDGSVVDPAIAGVGGADPPDEARPENVGVRSVFDKMMNTRLNQHEDGTRNVNNTPSEK